LVHYLERQNWLLWLLLNAYVASPETASLEICPAPVFAFLWPGIVLEMSGRQMYLALICLLAE
jgi:hypothetical protein